MDIGWLRDLVIIITGIIEIVIFIILGIIGWALSKHIRELSESAKKLTVSAQGVIDTAKVTVDNLASVSRFARSEIAGPLVKTASLIKGISAGLNAIMGFFQKKGGEDE